MPEEREDVEVTPQQDTAPDTSQQKKKWRAIDWIAGGTFIAEVLWGSWWLITQVCRLIPWNPHVSTEHFAQFYCGVGLGILSVGYLTLILWPIIFNIFKQGKDSKQDNDPRWFHARILSSGIVGGSYAFLLPAVMSLPEGGVNSGGAAALRQAILLATGGLIALIALGETRRKNDNDREAAENLRAHQENMLIQQKEQFEANSFKERKAERRERYTKAIEQLGDEKAPIRMGGVYTLVGLVDEWLEEENLPEAERLKEGQVIINNLCAYIRSPFTLASHYDELSQANPASEGIYKDKEQEFYADKATLDSEADVRLGIIKEIHDRLQGSGKNTPGAWSDFEYDFSGSTFFYPIDLTNSYYAKPINFSGSTYKSGAYFTDSTYQGWAYFTDSTYEGEAYFSGSTYQGWAYFTDSTYKDVADFHGSTYQGRAGFGGSTYQDSADFGGSTYKGWANFTDSTYKSWANFSGSTYQGRAGFGGSIYRGSANFSQSTYKKQAIFNSSTYQSEAYFNGSIYRGSADFSDTTYRGSADFNGSIYQGSADFFNSIYESWADFSDSTYQNWVSLCESTYSKQVNFGGSTYQDSVFLSDSTYQGRADFGGSTYQDSVLLGGSTYQDSADFSQSTYKKQAIFNGSTYQGEAVFSGSIFYSDAFLGENHDNGSSSCFTKYTPTFYQENYYQKTLFGSTNNDFTVDHDKGYPIDLNPEGIPLKCKFLTSEQKVYLEGKFQEIEKINNKLREVKDLKEKEELLKKLQALNKKLHEWREEATTVKVEDGAIENTES